MESLFSVSKYSPCEPRLTVAGVAHSRDGLSGRFAVMGKVLFYDTFCLFFFHG